MNANPWATRAGLLLIFCFVIALCWLAPLDVSASPTFQTVPPPPNDDFAKASEVGTLPYTSQVDNTAATTEVDEPTPACTYYDRFHTVWYVFHPTKTALVGTRASTPFYPVGAIYTGDTLTSLQEIRCINDWWGNPRYFLAKQGTTYYIQIGTQDSYSGGQLTLFVEPGPDLSVGFYYYPYSPTTLDTVYFNPSLYDPAGQSFVRYEWSFGDGTTSTDYSAQHKYANPGTYTVTFTATTEDGRSGSSTQTVSVSPPPPLYLDIFYSPLQPTTYETVVFQGSVYDPAYQTITSLAWNFGDGAVATGSFNPQHRYAKEGAYTVQFGAATADGRTETTSKVVSVENHDVAITKVGVPTSARVLQTKQVSVGVNSKYHNETVRVTLYKSSFTSSDGFEYVGESRQLVRATAMNKSTDFIFNYTFTGADAQLGKVTFKAIAIIEEGKRDLQPADNTYISLPVKVSAGKIGAASVEDDGILLFLPVVAGN